MGLRSTAGGDRRRSVRAAILRAGWRRSMTEFLRQSLVIAGKDLTIEARSKERLISMLTFAVLVGVVFTFSLDATVPSRSIAGAMLWVSILFAGMLGLGRSFTLEKEQDALVGVLLTPVGRGAFYFGKFLANLALVTGTTLLIFFVYGLFFQLNLWAAWTGLALVTALYLIGFMALGTLFSAVAASTRLGDSLLPIILLPLLIPVIFFGATAAQRLILGRPLEEVAGSIRMLGAFDLLFLFACTIVFGKVVEE
ncbi:MAG: cytochrome C biogenesis protein [Gemmatimonas sp.]|nr:cytochrome C biogenesis protein [Gemmatimonas sp.]